MFEVTTFSAAPAATQDATFFSKQITRRAQVSRACAWCRMHRVKCDAAIPCQTCKKKGRKCTFSIGKEEIRTFPGAIREIDRLSDRVRELEQRLCRLQSAGFDEVNVEEPSGTDHVTESTASPQTSLALPTHLDPLSELGVNKRYYNWDVVSTEKPNLHQQTYGTSSCYYFLRKMIRYMDMMDKGKAFGTSSLRLHTPSTSTHQGSVSGKDNETSMSGCDLSRLTEEVSLSNFWKLSDITASIIVRKDFESYYSTLWDPSRALRRSSALVDIMLALCLQHDAQSSWMRCRYQVSGTEDCAPPDLAGMWWYRRSQQMLIDDLEEPSIATFQCYLLSVIWLSNAGRHNTAHSTMASGIRIGIVLGLHLEPSQELASEQREFRKRLWWSAYALEMKFAMELGRPLAVNCTQVTCTLPVENAAILQGQQAELLFAIHLIKLILASRAVYITFYRRCAEELGKSGKESIYDDPEVLERCAKFMTSRIIYLSTWARHVPSVLHVEHNSGQPFGTDNPGSALDFSAEPFPIRRNIILELHYHNMAMSIFRPFIAFSVTPRPEMPNTEMHALSCARHAIVMTHMIRQAYIYTDYFDGSLEVWQWQWSAALSLIGYILAYPKYPITTDARNSVEIAILTLETSGRQAEAKVVRELVERADSPSCKAQGSGMTEGHNGVAGQGNLQNLDLPVTSASERNDTNLQDMDGFFDYVSGTMAPERMADSMLTLEDLDVGDCSVFEFLNFDAYKYS